MCARTSHFLGFGVPVERDFLWRDMREQMPKDEPRRNSDFSNATPMPRKTRVGNSRHTGSSVGTPTNEPHKQNHTAHIPGEDIGDVLVTYINTIESIESAVELATKALDDYGIAKRAEAARGFEKFLQNEHPGKQETPQFHPEDHWKTLSSLYDAGVRVGGAERLVPRSLFVSMVSEYESLLAKLLETNFRLHPEMCLLFKRPIEVQQALEFKSIEAMHSFVIAVEVDAVMRRNTAEQLQYFSETMHTFDISKCDGVPDVYEVSLRRNLYVHSDGMVGTTYLDECRRLHAKTPEDCQLGTNLQMTPTYFFKAGDMLLLLGLEIGTSLWWNTCRKDQDKIAGFLAGSVILHLLEEDQNFVAAHLGEYFMRQFKENLRDEDRRICVINTAQAYKWSKDEANCKRILETLDWEASGDYLRFGVAVLQGEYKEAANYMVKMGSHGSIDELNYHVWPLMKEFQKTKEFTSAYEEVFGRPFMESFEAATLAIRPDGDSSGASSPLGLQIAQSSPSRARDKTEHGGGATRYERN